MEWVETTGRTVEDAKEAALDELGVDESDAEFELLEEPRAGLFGRLRSEARVRARVKPTAPRSKDDRRDRRRRGRAAAGSNGDDESTTTKVSTAGSSGVSGDGAGASAPEALKTVAPSAVATSGAAATAEGPGTALAPGAAEGRPSGQAGSRRRRRGASRSPGDNRQVQGDAERQDRKNPNGTDMEVQDVEGAEKVEVPLDEQGRVAKEFLSRLTEEFGVNASIKVARPDDDTVDLELEGSDLGLLIGPKGATLLAIQDLTRTAVVHKTGANNGRIHVDVGGYRRKRTEALVRFAQQVAAGVQQNGTRTVLEPMSAADRKVVHDAINGIDGVSTLSEGEEPRRRVVVVPANR